MRRVQAAALLVTLNLFGMTGCAGRTVARGDEADPGAVDSPFEGMGFFVEWPEVGSEDRLPGAFLPAECWDLTPEAAGAPGEITQVRRPVRRGTGQGPRRQPPLLNPRPPPDPHQFWRRRPPDRRVVEQARQLYWQRLAEAQARYPNSTGYQEHHAVPIYLGGAADGPTYRVPTAYHKAITQAFRQRWPYGQRRPDSQKLFEILMEVYAEYPIPQLIGIQP